MIKNMPSEFYTFGLLPTELFSSKKLLCHKVLLVISVDLTK